MHALSLQIFIYNDVHFHRYSHPMTPSIDQQGGKRWWLKPEQAAWLVALCLLTTSAQDVFAARLGDIVSVSPIGQPLRVEISSPGSLEDQVAACIRVPSLPSPDGIPSVGNARASVIGRDQNARIVITHPEPAGEPILRLTLENTCVSRLLREYVLFLPEPLELASVSAAPPTRTARTSPVPPAAAPMRRGTQTWVTVPGESVNSLAQSMYPRDDGARRAFASGVLNANPHLFSSAADAARALPAGTELNVPSAASVAAASSAQRPATPRAQARAPAAEPVGQPAPAPTTRPATTPATPAPVADRLLLEQAAETGVADGGGGLRPEASELAREERLVAAIDRTIDTQLELLQRMRRLEEIQLALRAQLEAEETLPATAPRAPERSDPRDTVPERASERIPERAETPSTAAGENNWLGWAILLGVVVLLLALLLRRKGSDTGSNKSSRSRSRVSTSGTSVQGAWPDAAPTGTDERSVLDDRERPNQASPKAIPVALEWEDLDQPTEPAVSEVSTLAPLTLDDDTVEEHESAVELADIMVSFGRLQGAAETLADFIRSNPKQALTPWLKLMDVYRIADMKPEFDALARQLNKTFNVKTVTWANFDEARKHGGSVEAMPHIIKRITDTWRTRECQAYLESIVRDNREGTRQGFGLGVIDDILVLGAVLDEQLGRYKPPVQ